MARKSTFVIATTAGDLIALSDIPQDVKNDVDETYKQIKKNDGRTRVVFDSQEEMDLFSRQATSYAKQTKRVFRWSPTRGLPNLTKDYRVTDEVAPAGNGQAGK